ncbi:uncharacterized protein LOC121048213 [Ixodes scapularis]|uniref:Putative cuticular protein n=4 Tax=Ixodes TaxID=6944 RepID=A0A147BHE7_IXORI|nr:uncharacterized protein LOC121048213 [Ixodes scapularis]
MNSVVFAFGLTCLALAIAVPTVSKDNRRAKRAAYELPADAELIVGSYQTTFSCDGLRYGYYADTDNECKIFHICHEQVLADGTKQQNHWSFFCGNQTVFNQLTLTCAFPEEAVPCSNARDFYYVNDNIGVEDAPFLTDDDVARGQALYSGYGARLSGRAAAASKK